MQLTPKRASIALVIGGCMWGIYWLPLTHLEGQGLTGATAGIALYVACLVLLLPAIWRNRALFIIHYKALLFSGILTGAAISLFSTSLAYTDVIRTILLFYLTPVWGVILGAIFLKERVTRARGFVIFCAFAGLYIILGGDGGLPIPHNIGDVFALIAGVLWAIGSLGLLRSKDVPTIPQIIAFLLGGLVVSLITHAVIGAPLAIEITPQAMITISLTALAYGCYALPMIWLTIAPAQLLTPARVGILLMSEVIIGATSAALLSGEPFGPLEASGTILITLAAFIELKTTKVEA